MRPFLSGGMLAVFGSIAVGTAAAGDAVDCKSLKVSAAPFELQMRQSDGQTFPVQVYRGENLTRVQYTKVGDHLIISKFQANFQLDYADLAGTNVRFVYSVPTDRYIWQQDSRVVTYRTSIAGAALGPGFTQVYEMLPDADVPLGNCSFKVKRFRFEQASEAKASQEEIWFSPELNTNLWLTEVTSLPDGKATTRKLEAAAIATDFVPLR